MIRTPIKQRSRLVLGVVSILLLALAYTLLAEWQKDEAEYDADGQLIAPARYNNTVPSWRQFTEGLDNAFEWNETAEGRWIVIDAKATVYRLAVGLAIGVGLAIVLGLLMGCFPLVEAFLSPPISLLAKVPPTAALAVFFVMVGTEMSLFVAMIAFGVAPVLAQSIYLSVKAVPDELLHKAYTLGASHVEVIWNIVCRHILPQLLDAIRLQIGPALVYLIAAEYICADEGFGYRIRMQQRLLNMNVVYPYLIFLAAFGFIVDYGLRRLQRITCPWHVPGR